MKRNIELIIAIIIIVVGIDVIHRMGKLDDLRSAIRELVTMGL